MPARNVDPDLRLPSRTIVDARTRAAVEHADLAAFRNGSHFSLRCTADDVYLRIAVADLDRVRLASVECSSHRATLVEPHFVTLLRPVRGTCTVSCGRRSTTAEPGRSLLLDRGERTTSVGPHYQGLQALLPWAALAETMTALAQEAPPCSLGELVLDGANAAAVQLDAYLCGLVRALSAADGEALGSSWARLAADRALLALAAGAALEGMASGDAAAGRVAAPWQVRRAEEILSARAREPVTIAEVCRELKVGARSLQLAFRRHRGTTAQRFLQDCRLELARRRLLEAGHRCSVTEIAHECGFAHGGRFAHSYRHRYGEWPSATRLRARS
jgi:AraC-like DNA-binding protein